MQRELKVKSIWRARRLAMGTGYETEPDHRFIRRVVVVVVCLTLLVDGESLAVNPQDDAERHLERGLKLAQQGNPSGAESELREAAQLAPANAQILSSLGTVLAQEKKLEESTTVFQEAVKLAPKDATARRYLAANLWQLKRYSESKQNLETILRDDPADRPARLLLGMVAENMKDYVTAVKMLASVLHQVRQQPESMVALARSYYHLGRTQKARATLAELSDNRTGPAAVFLGAEIADEMQDYATAEKMFLSIRAKFPDQASLGYRLALSQYHAKRFADSQRTLLDFIAAGHNSAPLYNLLGWCYYKQNEPTAAVRALEQAVQLAPEEEANYLDLGQIFMAGDSLSSALSLARKATSELPGSARMFELQGLVETRMGQFTDAIKSYSRAVQLDSASVEAVLGLAQAQFSAGLEKEAAITFETGIERFPREARLKVGYATVLLKQAETGHPGAEHRAAEMLQSALALNRLLPSAHYELGNLALRKGSLPEAIAHLERAVKLDPQSSEAHFALARAYRQAGRKQEAAREMNLYEIRKGKHAGQIESTDLGAHN